MVFGMVCASPNERYLSCLSLWERPAVGRVRVPSVAERSTKAPSPRPSPSGRGRTKIDSCVAISGQQNWCRTPLPSWPSLTRRKLRFAILAALSFQRRSIGMGNAPHPYFILSRTVLLKLKGFQAAGSGSDRTRGTLDAASSDSSVSGAPTVFQCSL